VPDPLILIPPSEGKAVGGAGAAWHPGSMAIDLDEQRLRVIAALRSAMRSNATVRGKLLGVKGDALARATAANRSIDESPTLPAAERFTGVLYDALDLASLPAAVRRRADRSVLIPSGVFGLLTPSDPIPDHRLKMSVVLGSLGRLSTWWRDSVSAAVAEQSHGRTVWNLLPNEHAASVRLVGVPQYSVTFLEPGRAGNLVAVSHWNKLLKGELVRHVLRCPSAGPDDLLEWRHPSGFGLDRARTERFGEVTRLAFVKE